MASSFDRIFRREKLWKHEKLSGNMPCKQCETYKEFEVTALFGSIAERGYLETPENCKTCIQKLQWELDCMEKLEWYENNDPNLKN